MAQEDKKKSVWLTYSDEEKSELEKVSAGYIDFISTCKTERESVKEAIRMAQSKGYIDFQSLIRSGTRLQIGDKVYFNFMNKAIVLFNIGLTPITKGLSILGAHIDTCRLDIKQNPVYEDGGLCYLDTHYYGGIKKYQWVTLPLAMHGVVVKHRRKSRRSSFLRHGSVDSSCAGTDEKRCIESYHRRKSRCIGRNAAD